MCETGLLLLDSLLLLLLLLLLPVFQLQLLNSCSPKTRDCCTDVLGQVKGC
jgi:hypothetical protein